jgi:hypothetical protein
MFERAEKLGMTVGRMMHEMTYAELVDWMALDSLRVKEAEKAQRLAKKGMQQQRPRRRR